MDPDRLRGDIPAVGFHLVDGENKVTISSPSRFSSMRRFLWTGLLLSSCVLQSSLAQTQAAHTATDFESARTAAETSIAGARKALRLNAGLRATAEDSAARLTTVTQSTDNGPLALRTLSDIDSLLQSLLPPASTTAITDALTKAASTLNDPKNTLTTSKTQLESLKNTDDFKNMDFDLQNRVSQTLIDSQAVLDQISQDDGLNSEINKKLKVSLARVLAQAVAVTDGFAKAVKPLSDLGDVVASSATEDQQKAVLKSTGKYLTVYVDTVCLKKPYTDQWNTVGRHLKALDSSADISAVQTNLGKLDQEPISKIPTFLPHWLDVVKQMPSAEMVKLEKLITDVDADASANTASAVEELRKANSLRDSFKGVEDSWTKLLPVLDCLGPAGGPLSGDNVTDSLAAFTKASHTFFGALSGLQEAIAGDFSKFEADQQQLFYFTNVPRLMQMLNPGTYEIGGIQGAQEYAAVQRHKLAQAELDLAAAQADVNTYQTRLMQLPEELKQARADARKQDQTYGKTANRLASLSERLGASATALQSANNAAAAVPTDKAAQQAAQRAQQDKDRLTAQNADAQRDNANAQHDKDVADQKLKAAEDEQTGIPAQIEKAKIALQAAQTGVSQRRQESLLAAQAESDAFALARDNTPYWYAPANGTSKDPARRVEMYGTNDSKIIYLRGKRADLEEVKNIIAGIDTPAAQARITLWSLQLNYTSDTKGNAAKRMNNALFLVEDSLAEIRSRMAISVSLLRDSVNVTVNKAVKSQCGNGTTADDCRLKRIRSFYNQQVLLELGDDVAAPANFKSVSRFTVPDPSGTTTLGEALLILSLAKPKMRQCALTQFETRINNTQTHWKSWYSSEKFGKTDKKYIITPEFTRLRRALDMDVGEAGPVVTAPITAPAPATPAATTTPAVPTTAPAAATSVAPTTPAMPATPTAPVTPAATSTPAAPATPTVEDSELTSAQLEITRAISSAAFIQIARRIANLSAQLKARNDSLVNICNQISAIDTSVLPKGPLPSCKEIRVPPGLKAAAGSSAELTSRRESLAVESYQEWGAVKGLNDEIVPLLWFYWQHFGTPPESFKRDSRQGLASAVQTVATNSQAGDDFYSATKLSSLLASHPLRVATAREAAADEMLKEMMTAMEEDLDRIFVRPGLANLRDDLAGQPNLQVGVLQRTSTLATNRLQARVDPRASAQLALGEEQDILQSVTQLGQIYLAAQTGGAFGTLNALNNLKQQTKAPPQEIYGITTGSTFKITPIFDPSGQALRFKFDFVSANNVTEPNGTMNAQLPRIERHTVNTEVQISNHELREVSRYEANSKLGLPTKYWGGVPIFKDILEEFPRVRPYVPIFGWFVRKAGSGAASQESLLFGQTTIYPTIGDIVELLTGGTIPQ